MGEQIRWTGDHALEAQLPKSELGACRSLEVGYFGHGDIVISLWPDASEPDLGEQLKFRFIHGSDVIILATVSGYLKRLGKSHEEVKGIMLEAGAGVLEDKELQDSRVMSSRSSTAKDIAKGDYASRWDIPGEELACLVMPIPAVPGLLEETGGTGIYTRGTGGEGRLVLAALRGRRSETGSEDTEDDTEIAHTAELCSSDAPIMARMICDVSLGDYRKDIYHFLTNFDKTTDNGY